MADSPVIEREKCDGCGLCIDVCHCNILVLVDNVITVIEEKKCVSCNRWCAQCEMICPTGAITIPFDVVIEER
ncbi:MAG TPA: 4Fe-4S ferredoxin [Dehalococcoidia bacterium]|nr:4Fe-4S ferredoxin [Dehalococcoidia bacterium]